MTASRNVLSKFSSIVPVIFVGVGVNGGVAGSVTGAVYLGRRGANWSSDVMTPESMDTVGAGTDVPVVAGAGAGAAAGAGAGAALGLKASSDAATSGAMEGATGGATSPWVSGVFS